MTVPWPAETPLRAHSALHNGEADLREGDFCGRAVNRDFSPPRTLDAVPNNLPVQLTPLVGRDRAASAAAGLLEQQRLVTLTGAGGSGKTRLALQVAADVVEDYPDGVWFVELAPVQDPALVPRTIATATSVREETSQSLLDTLAGALASRRVLLVLDNCEHVLDACRAAVDRLLRSAVGLKVLATSRAPLNLYGEQEFPVPPLAVPEDTGAPADTLLSVPSVALFFQRARAVKPDLRPSAEDVRHAAEVCRRLDGLPLGIELAAARTRLFTPQALLARLLGAYGQTPLRLLTGGLPTLPSRQQTLRGAIAWSYDLLPAAERALFRRLAVFAGGCTLEAVEAVATAAQGDAVDVLDRLASLVEKNLVKQVAQADGEPRFFLLEMIRDFGLEQLDTCAEAADARRRHAAYYVRLGAQAATELRGAQQQRWLEALDREHDNLREALRWLAGEPGPAAEDGLRLAAGLCRYWELRGRAVEGREWLQWFLTDRGHNASAVSLRARAEGLLAAGVLAHDQDDYAAARHSFAGARVYAEQLADCCLVARGILGTGDVLRYTGDLSGALEQYTEALALWRPTGDRYWVAQALYSLGTAIGYTGDYARARPYLLESLALRREIGDRHGEAWCLHILAVGAQKDGAIDEARAAFEEGLALRQELGDRNGVAYSSGRLGQIALLKGDLPAARVYLTRAVRLARDVGDHYVLTFTLGYCGELLAAEGRPRAALRLLSAASHQMAALGTVGVAWSSEQQEAATARIRALLPDGDACAAWEAGAAMSLDEAIAFFTATGVAPEPAPSPQPAPPPAQAAERPLSDGSPRAARPASPAPPASPPAAALTRREREVVALVAEGLTNRQIAQRLVISERTADTHVQHVLGKLGFSTRSQVAAWAARQAA